MPSMITTRNPAIIGFLPDGKPVYEIRGGAPEEGEEQPQEGDTDSGAEDEGEDAGLDDKVKAKLTKLRGEAAGWRTQLREAETKLAAAKTVEEFEAARTELQGQIAEKDQELLATRREVVIAKHKLPADLAALLPTEGKTIEELEVLAKGLAKYAPEDDEPEGSGGLNPRGGRGSDATDPASLAKKVAGQRPRFR